MQTNPLVSVLMTVYNRELYIKESIQSVLDSTYENFELIILDDRSTDNSYHIAAEYARKDVRIKLYQNEKNLGQFPNRNKIVEYASGKYIKYLDSDDLIYPHGLQVMVWAIEQYPQAGIAVSFPKTEDSSPYPILLSPEEAYKEQFYKGVLLDLGPSGTIINRDAFLKIGGFPNDNYVGNDTVFLYHMAALFPVVKMPTSLVWWRQHEGQAFNQGHINNEYLYKHFLTIKQALQSKICPLNEQDTIIALQIQKQRHSRYLLHIAIKKHKIKTAYKAFKKTRLSIGDICKGFKPYQ
jgi:glycosyltransferase involved in cell wall biosynthesis